MSIVGYCCKSDVFNNYTLLVVQFLNIKFLCTPLMCDIYSMPSVTSEIAL